MADKSIVNNQQEEQAKDPGLGALNILTAPGVSIGIDALLKGKAGMLTIQKKGEKTENESGGRYELGVYRYAPKGEKGGILAKVTPQLSAVAEFDDLDTIDGFNIGTAKITDIFLSMAMKAPIDKKTGTLIGGKNYRLELPAVDYGRKYGIFPDRKSAIRAFQKAGPALLGMRILVKGEGKRAASQNMKEAVLFTSWEVKNNVTYLTMNGDANWGAICAWFVSADKALLQLSKGPYGLARHLYEHANKNKTRITDTGEAPPISILQALEWAGLDLKHRERLKDYAEAINGMITGLEVQLDYEESDRGNPITNRGKLHYKLYGAALAGLRGVADKQKDIKELIKARRKKKVAKAQKEAAEAQLQALETQKALEAAIAAEREEKKNDL